MNNVSFLEMLGPDTSFPDYPPFSPDRDSAVCRKTPLLLTDEAREAAIKLAGKAVERHMARYQQTHCFGDLGMADRARLSMEALIKGRSADYVAKLERERGLA